MRSVLKKRHEGGVGMYVCDRGMFVVINYVRGKRCCSEGALGKAIGGTP